MPVNLDLATIRSHRDALAAATADRADAGAELATAQADVERLSREAPGSAELANAETRARAGQARLAELFERRTAADEAITAAAGELLAATDETGAVTSLDGRVPVALLPVSIETRFSPDRTQLHIRVYPDQIHIDGHEPELTEDERLAGQWYWAQRWPDLDHADLAETAWRSLAERFGPGRARYLVDTLRPLNIVAAPGAAPTYPETALRGASWTRAIEATALPERWIAIGYKGTAEVFRVWSDRVLDRLAAGPTPAEEESPAAPEAEDSVNVQDALKWAVDLDAAKAAGMALTVTDSDLTQGNLSSGLSKLVVLGVDWTLSPDEAAATLDELLRGHAASGDLAFVTPGTPTNNTGAVRSGFNTAPEDQVGEWAPPLSDPDPDATSENAAGTLAGALGIASASLATVPGADDRRNQVEAALIDALWEATGGYYATEMLEPLGSDALTAALRDHAARHLRPSGPLPLIRVGPQPYGVLPVVAPSFEPAPGDAGARVIATLGSTLKALWTNLTGKVPQLGRVGEQTDVDEIMLDLLQRTPVPWTLRWREMMAAPQWSSTTWAEAFRSYQGPHVNMAMALLGLPSSEKTRIQYLTANEESHRLRVPLVLKGDEGTAYLAEIADLARSGADGRRQLNLRQNSIALLEALLAFAATQELDKAATGELIVGLSPDEVAVSGLTRLGVRTPDLVRVDKPTAAPRALDFVSARTLAAATVPNESVLAHDRVAERLAASLIDVIGQPDNPARSIARFLTALEQLTDIDAETLEWSFRGVLDLYSVRLDAWLTSLATSHLARHRKAQPTGIHIGCYGWVEDLSPDSGAAAESLGYVMAPSLAHAVTAAILRSGRQAHAESGAFDIDISSHRAREAMSLLEGVAAGQSIAALVGYRVERSLTDAGLADLIVPLRLQAPLQSRDAEHDEPMESVAARDVVDGVRLLSLLAGPHAVWDRLIRDIGAQARRQALENVLGQVAAIYDAVADVLFAESVHQTAMGNLERASAAAGALDRQERPVRPQVDSTPRDGAIVTNRVVVALSGSTPAPGWPDRGIRGDAEPRLDSWLGEVMGRPDQLRVSGRMHRVLDGGHPVVELGQVSAAELGLSPLALALAAIRPGDAGGTELDTRLREVFTDRVPDLTSDDRIEIDGHSLLHTVTAWAGQLAGGHRALEPQDLAAEGQTSEESPGTVDADELAGRVHAVISAVRELKERLESADQPGNTATQLRQALDDATELIGVDAMPRARPGVADEVELLRTQVAEVSAMLTRTLAGIDNLMSTPLGADEEPAERQLALGALALGSEQPILPVSSPANRTELSASLTDRDALLGGDDSAVITWLQRAGLVRPELDQLCGLLTHAEADGHDVIGDLTVVQLPHRAGARWCELPFGAEGPSPEGSVGIVVVATGGFDPTERHAGLVVDEWAEVIPSTDHSAGLTFHYDAPGARPPQAIVLAVHPEPDPDRWDLDTLIATVNETGALARLRTLSLKETEGFAGLFPALYLPNNYTRDVPSVSLQWLAERAEGAGLVMAESPIKGK